jgi:predicted O-methyltransferase YrrM
MAITTAAEVADLVDALPAGIAPERGEELYRFIREHRPRRCLELGVGHGVSALYIGAALEANGVGTLTSVDRRSAEGRSPPARDMIAQAGLSARVDVVYEETSYTWFLHDALRAQVAADGRIEPRYDFAFIDGAHTWDVDALAFALTDRLLRPGGWILFDDLDWKLDERWPSVPPRQRALAQVSEIWNLLVVTHPDYDELHSDGKWGWARKSPSAPVASRLLVRRELVGATFALFRAGRARLEAAHRRASAHGFRGNARRPEPD